MQEREVHSRLRERSSRLEADLTQLQASSTLASAQAGAEKVCNEGLLIEWLACLGRMADLCQSNVKKLQGRCETSGGLLYGRKG